MEEQGTIIFSYDITNDEDKSEIPTSTFKLIVLGDTTVGKTSIIHRFVNGQFTELIKDNHDVIGMHKKKLININDNILELQIFDTDSSEPFGYLDEVKSMDGIIFVYDVCSSQSYEILRNWLSTENGLEGISKLVVGNKNDMTMKKQVSTSMGKLLGECQNALFYETSANSGQNIEDVFVALPLKKLVG